jgi:predicted LPLAT superfamily acyltransferase
VIVRAIVCIPTFNNETTILNVIEGCINKTNLPILIMDDGSKYPVKKIIEDSDNTKVKNLLDKRIFIHRNKLNNGKGTALQEAFNICVSKNYTHLISIDGDGQHHPDDINFFIKEIKKSPWSLIIGKRKFSGENVPTSSKFGRKFSNFWVKYQTGCTTEDSQSGFRSYPLFFVQNMKFFTKRYDFEIEVLIRLIWKKVSIKEITIDVYYPPEDERISHFDKLWDNVKISILNTIFVIVSLLKGHTGGLKSTISLAIGVFFAVQPIYGLQAFILGFIAFVFRLNFSLMFLSSQISIPPMIPIWTFISLKIGSSITHTPLLVPFSEINLEIAKSLMSTWILGSLILGAILSLIVFLIYGVISLKSNVKKKDWSGKSRGGIVGNWIMGNITNHFGPRTAYTLLYFICPYFYLFAPKAVLSHNQYFKIMYLKQGFFKRQFLILKTFFQLGKILIDNIYAQKENENYFEINKNGNENLLIANKIGQGHLLVGAHIGGWMLASKVFAKDKGDSENSLIFNIVEFDSGKGHKSQDKINESSINFILNTDDSPIFKINQALTQNEVVIFMGDRLFSDDVELVPFLGKLAPFEPTPFRIAVAKKASLSFSFGLKKNNNEYDLFISNPINNMNSSTQSKQEQVYKLIEAYVESIEEKLKIVPLQWFNFYPYWSTLSDSLQREDSKKSKVYLKEEL